MTSDIELQIFMPLGIEPSKDAEKVNGSPGDGTDGEGIISSFRLTSISAQFSLREVNNIITHLRFLSPTVIIVHTQMTTGPSLRSNCRTRHYIVLILGSTPQRPALFHS